MYFSLIITFLLVLVILVASIQNIRPLELTFFTWKLQISLTALIFYSSLVGGAIVAVLTLPKLTSKYLKIRGLKNEIYELKKRSVELEKVQEERSD
ncbi:MAG: lipopolysaccharide assembly protein LapA domain-containing protein [Pseudomonadota bacterium]